MAKITKPCTVCGKPVTRYPSLFGRKYVYCSPECNSENKRQIYKGENNPCWRGGRRLESTKGYIQIRHPGHPRARKNGYVLEHILVAEEMLGRPLLENEVVHHRNGNGQDNRPENLDIFASNGEHLHSAHSERGKPPCKCGRPHKGHGLCTRHLSQLRRTGKTWDFDNEYTELQQEGELGRHSLERILLCKCGRPVHARGYCGKHYQRWRLGNTPIFE